MTQSDTDNPLFTKLRILEAEDVQGEDCYTVCLLMAIKTGIDAHTVWRLVCDRKRGVTDDVQIYPDLHVPACHAVKWSEYLKSLEIVYISGADQDDAKLTFDEVSLQFLTTNKLTRKKEMSVLPKWLYGNNIGAKRLILTNDFIFVLFHRI